MLHNYRNDLASIIRNISREQFIKNIRIYNKAGQIKFSSDPAEIDKAVSKDDEQCIFCHTSDHAKGTISKENRFREIPSTSGVRYLGLINPIETEPACYNADCHVHSPDEHLLGLLDFTLSMQRLDENKAKVQLYSFILFAFVTIVSMLIFARIIRIQIQRPISKLIHGTHQIAELNLDYSINMDRPAEMVRLAESFNIMVKKLKAAQDELQRWSDTLEQRVLEKTQELKKANDQLLMAEKLSSMGKLAATVAHEINNPLSGILTYANLIIRLLEGQPDTVQIEQSLKNLKIIRDESKRCGDIIQNMLLFAKSSFGRRSHNNLIDIVEKSVQLVQHSMEMKNVKLVKSLPEQQILFECDASAIEQMFVALLINAIEACPGKNGELKLTVQSDHRTYIEIMIADNGIGIDDELLPHIFEPFFTTKRNGRSVGLGLAVVYGIVENHYGTIEVESKRNKGTTFRIQFPLNRETK